MASTKPEGAHLTSYEPALTGPEVADINKSSSRDEPPPGVKDDASLSPTQEDGTEINFKNLEWWQAGLVMIAETISLGILSLPSAIANIGLAPGIVLILFLGILSTISGLVMGEFKRAYPWVKNFGDAGEVLGRPIGMGRFFQEFFGWAQTIFQIFVMGSHLLTWTICLNTLTDSSTCTIVWAFVGLAVFWVLNIPRTLKYTSYMSIVSFLSIFTAVLMTMIDVGIERPIGSGHIDVSRQLSFTTAFLPVTNIAVAFSGHSCFFAVMSELKKPEDWSKALALLQICDTTIYLVAAIVIYFYVGPDVPSPALTAAASLTLRKAIWGIAIPTIVIAGVIYGHVAAKYVFDRVFAGTVHIEKRTRWGTAGWAGITVAVWAIALVIAESIPVFSSLLGLVCALFASWFSYGIPGILWLFMYKGAWFRDGKSIAMFGVNVALFLTGLTICALGLWSSATAISAETGTAAWTCKSNAG
ncbi:Uu.00g069170.m01.CDS01 [Anthostomella pinea]|uniref:Uu.00g069170.m01.CDS01 n=1 Tax=Anthostomella pinea TaxID=933095 RepID=A0AAI8VUF8_9PEZI|nr:Uu.00g069170.m01.CDS01 [Anthostomella pinea]